MRPSLPCVWYRDFRAFLDHLFTTRSPEDLELVLNKLTTNYTFFLREKDHFTYFADHMLPALAERHRDDRVLSIWSAGCSSGEEPYTLSIYLKEYFGPQAGTWDTRVLATDISHQALAKARAGDVVQWCVMGIAWLSILAGAPLWLTLAAVGVFLLYSVLSLAFMIRLEKEM